MKKLLALLLLLGNVVLAQQTAGTTGTLDPNQIYTTGNIVQPTVAGTNQTPWVNGVYQDQLTCWAWGNPGYCGPNAIVRPGNNINFSFGMTDLYQVQSIASVLPTTGLRVNGYNFGFMAKNGNGWDDGRQDYLTAYVSFYGTDGKIKDYTNYDLNSKFNWTQFNYTKDFVTPYADKDLSTVRYGFVGMDNNFWAGPYGPEIYNVSFSLKYSVDPCAVNVLSSPTCPGYLDALAKLAPAPTTITTDPITTTSTSPTTTTTIVTDPIASTVNVTSTTTIGQPTVVAPAVSAPAPITASSTNTTTTSSSSSSSSNSSTAQATKESSPASGGNVSLALSIINKNSERDAAGSAVAQTAIAQAQAVANQAQQEAQSVAAQAVSNSVIAGQTALKTDTNNSGSARSTNGLSMQSDLINQSNSQINLVIGPTTSNNTNSSAQKQEQVSNIAVVSNNQNNTTNQTIQTITINNNDSNKGVTATVTPISTALPMQPPQQSQIVASNPLPTSSSANQQQPGPEQQPQTQSTYSLLPPQQPVLQVYVPQIVTNEVQQQPTNTPQQTIQTNNEVVAMLSPNMLTDKSNPLTDIVEGKQNIPQNNTTATTGPSVNKNAGDNDVAGGVDINKMALAPIGYASYLNFTMRDAAFYAPKEVYRNQINVDNARALRQLTNDARHRELVELQYAK